MICNGAHKINSMIKV